ncbi:MULTISPECIES: efflux RND transporter periplasmic adaptor subunit [Nitratireductor]|uniref:efflux RND transporter periplasmic adaptor subunit n=1 Tax=Nitratireductor TaxID=245876 RepID=UPI000D0D34AF|nr:MULTISPECIES: efflux RND transporter periplasmic adaptor subunit [Nitratireductor]PSM17979.1 efflux transporter periplasmic adaptor subunit [Nitratireductor sp. StC3]
MVKRFLIALVLVALVAGGLVGFNMFRDQAISQFFANRPRPAVTVSTAKVESLTWTPRIQAIGTVGAARGVDLTVETTGIVQDVRFEANDRVEEGQTLVVLDNNVQRADLEAARAKAQLDKQVLTRAQELLKRGVGSETAVESAQAAATASASQVAKLEAVLAQKELMAPFSGTIGIPRVEKGQYIAPGNTVATLQDLDTLRADFSVPEQNLPLLEIGLPVRYGLSEDSLDFSGKVTGIEPRVDPQTRLVALRAEITDAGGRLSPGQFVQVRVELPAEGDVLVVPQTALITSLYGDYLFVVAPAEDAAEASDGDGADDGPALIARQVFVKTGRRAGGVIEIVSGVSAGDEVVTAGQNRLTNNGPVAVDNSVEPAAARSGEAAAQ